MSVCSLRRRLTTSGVLSPPPHPDMVIDSMLASGQLEEGVQDKVREAMLKRHHHQNEMKLSNRIPLVRSFADIGKKHSDPHLLERNGEAKALPVALTSVCLPHCSPKDEARRRKVQEVISNQSTQNIQINPAANR